MPVFKGIEQNYAQASKNQPEKLRGYRFHSFFPGVTDAQGSGLYYSRESETPVIIPVSSP